GGAVSGEGVAGGLGFGGLFETFRHGSTSDSPASIAYAWGMWTKRLLSSFVALAAAGCAHYGAYYQADADEYPDMAAYGQPPQEAFTTASYKVPSANPHGSVHVVSMGSER